jgi:NADPH:quinone reductase-like Zn-dependent oxidoreductase
LGGFDRQLRAVALSRLVGQRLRMLSSKPRQQDLQVLQELIEAGKVTAVIDRTFPLSQVPQAIRYLVEGPRRWQDRYHGVALMSRVARQVVV